ncbi:cytochrome P450 [Aspergillus crustosus]
MDYKMEGLFKGCRPLVLPLLLVGSFLAGYILYFVYFHPLAKYPGPFLSKITTARAAYHAWKGDLHLDMWPCHRQYGPLVRYGPNHLMFESSTALKDIYTPAQNVSKPDYYQGLGNGRANLLTLSDKKEHSRRRRLIGSGFTDISLREFIPELAKHISRFCATLDRESRPKSSRQWGQPLNMSDWCSYLTFDIMCDFVFGVSYNLLESEEYSHVIDDIEDANIRATVLVWAPYLYLGRLDKKLFRHFVRARNRYLNFLNLLIKDSSAREARKHDIFAYLTSLTGSGEGETLDPRQVLSESSVLVVAGYDTTATALCAILFYLTRNPHAYSKLTTEIRSKFSPATPIFSPRDLENTPYLTACIDEALRMSPSVASCLFRQVGPDGIIIDNHHIPPRTLVGNGIYSLHHNPKNFDRADEYIPERWLDEEAGLDSKSQTESDSVAKSKGEFAPFSIGSRACIGKSLALMELSMTVAILLKRYDFRVASGEGGGLGRGGVLAGDGRANPGEFQLYDRITCAKRGPLVQLRRL